MVLRSFLLILAMFAAIARGEENCGSMLRSMNRFRGKVEAIRTYDGPVAWAADGGEVMFLVDISVIAPSAGETRTFGIHSPSRTFGAEEAIGKTFELEAEQMECDGKFRRFLTLRRHLEEPLVEQFDGDLEVGHTYRASAKRTEGGSIALTKPVELLRHHVGGIVWPNPGDLSGWPEGETRDVVFEVVSVQITYEGDHQWMSIYDAKVISHSPPRP